MLEGAIEVWEGEPPPPFGLGDTRQERMLFRFEHVA